jgi:mannose-6-phosphate isomerase-like protein (cupin superfamily)
VPRNSAYRIEPSASRFEYVAVRVFLSRSDTAATGPTETGRIPTVTSKTEIDKFFASATQSEPLGAGDTVTLGRIIHNGKPSPWESHETADQICFVRHGTAQASLDGFIVDAKLTAPGQIRGSGVIGASQFTIGPGDIVWIPRNTAHFIDPGSGKVGYFLVGLPTSEQYMPKSISQGKGAL